MVVAKSKKVAYFAHLEECLTTYPRAAIVHADFVGSKQISDIRIALRGKAEMVFGKNTMIRRCIRNMCKDEPHPEWQSIVDVMKGNLGFIFTHGDLNEILDTLKEFVKPAAAKAGVIAPCSCSIPKGPTGLDPAQTSFFQALNIATKINKGSIEIINDVTVIHEGMKVGTSEAALLTKLGVKPFEYGLVVKYIWEGGVFSPDVLKIDESVLMEKWNTAVGFVTQLSLATNFLTEASLACTIGLGFKNVLAVAVESDYIEFPQAQQVKDFLDNPDAFLASVPSGGGGGGGGGGGASTPAAAAAAPPPPPEEEEEEEEMGFDLFD
jgi:large subunit ribosomal protein LP0